MPFDRSLLHGTGLSESHVNQFLDYIDNLELSINDAINTANMALASSQQNEIATANNTATLEALTNNDQEVMIWPLEGTPDWELRIPGDINGGIICNSKNDLAQWKYEQLSLGLKNSAIIRISDTLGKPGLLLQVFYASGGSGAALLGTATSAGTSVPQDIIINFNNAVQGPGVFIFKATTPNPAGLSGTYTITRCRIRI
jgi:hypothetical protein